MSQEIGGVRQRQAEHRQVTHAGPQGQAWSSLVVRHGGRHWEF